MKHEGKYVAAPVNVHRVNWMWVNPSVFKKVGAKIPTTWAEFFTAAKKIQAAGIVPLAHGGQTWQDATLFEVVVLGVGGGDFYRKAFVEADAKTLGSKKMVEILTTFRKIRSFMDKGAPGRDWNVATGMVINGKAAMQIMGDWAKGEFLAANKVIGKDFACVAAPSTAGKYSYGIDSFATFNGRKDKGVEDFAVSIMDERFQKVFNKAKGSIPARSDVSIADFDDCAKSSRKEFQVAEGKKDLVPSMAHGMATPAAMGGEFVDIVSQFFNNPKITAEKTAAKLAKAAKYAH